jgi:hypothetical protein
MAKAQEMKPGRNNALTSTPPGREVGLLVKLAVG